MNTKLKKRIMWTLGISAGLVVAWAAYTVFYEGSLGQPTYTLVDTQDDIEYRRYEPFVVASIQTSEAGRPGLNQGFRTLAGYIFGGNRPGESLAMTAPVLQQNDHGESIPMTAPVLESPEAMRMAFVMPEDRSIDNLPAPLNKSVSLTEVNWGEVAAIRFSGAGKQAKFQKAEKQLREALANAGRAASGPALYAQYNSPSAFPPLRRNEVLLPLKPTGMLTQ